MVSPTCWNTSGNQLRCSSNSCRRRLSSPSVSVLVLGKLDEVKIFITETFFSPFGASCQNCLSFSLSPRVKFALERFHIVYMFRISVWRPFMLKCILLLLHPSSDYFHCLKALHTWPYKLNVPRLLGLVHNAGLNAQCWDPIFFARLFTL